MAAINTSSKLCFSEKTCSQLPVSAMYSRPLLAIESNFDGCLHFTWLTENWKINYIFIGAYLVAIFAGRKYMKSRQAFQLRGALFAWNAALAVLSMFAAWRTASAVLYQIGLVGFHEIVCGTATKQYRLSVAIYMWYFAFSKFVELGDTAFIILRKTPLIFLHWFHHATVCFFVWSCSAYPTNIHVLFMTMNYVVHSFMYSYYMLKVLRVPVPKPIGMAITSLQLFQMLGGVYMTLYTYYMKDKPGVGCCVNNEAITIAASIYMAYFILFLNFFAQAYIFKKSKHGELARKKK